MRVDLSSPAYHPIFVSKYSGTFEEGRVRVADIYILTETVIEEDVLKFCFEKLWYALTLHTIILAIER